MLIDKKDLHTSFTSYEHPNHDADSQYLANSFLPFNYQHDFADNENISTFVQPSTAKNNTSYLSSESRSSISRSNLSNRDDMSITSSVLDGISLKQMSHQNIMIQKLTLQKSSGLLKQSVYLRFF